MSQGKTVVQAEIDAAAELIDFFRFNAKHAIELEQQQPLDSDGSTNTMLYRGLEVRSLNHQMTDNTFVCANITLTCTCFRVLLLLSRRLTSQRLVETWPAPLLPW